MAGEEPFALAALGGEGVALGAAEALLLGAVHHVGECALVDVAEEVFGEYEVVAGIDVAIVLHGTCVAAGLSEGAYSWGHADPVGEGGVEELYEGVADVVAHPFVEDGA